MTTRARIRLAAILTLTVSCALEAMAAGVCYVTVEGTKQGKLKGESSSARWEGSIEAIGVTFQADALRDRASGLAAGRQRNLPLTITKKWGAATPQLFQALVTSEALKIVTLQFVATNANGQEYVAHTVRLVGASISGLRQYTIQDEAGGGADMGPFEDVTFTYQDIDLGGGAATTGTPVLQPGARGTKPVLKPGTKPVTEPGARLPVQDQLKQIIRNNLPQ